MSLGKEEARSILDQPQVRRLVFNHDKICFKHCIKTPAKNLSPSDEQCLNDCSGKVTRGLEYIRKISETKQAIIGSEPKQ